MSHPKGGATAGEPEIHRQWHDEAGQPIRHPQIVELALGGAQTPVDPDEHDQAQQADTRQKAAEKGGLHPGHERYPRDDDHLDEMDDRGVEESPRYRHVFFVDEVRAEGHGDEHQADQREGARAHEQVEIVPGREDRFKRRGHMVSQEKVAVEGVGGSENYTA